MRDGDDRRDLNPRPALRRSAINGTPPMALPTELRPSHQRAGLDTGCEHSEASVPARTWPISPLRVRVSFHAAADVMVARNVGDSVGPAAPTGIDSLVRRARSQHPPLLTPEGVIDQPPWRASRTRTGAPESQRRRLSCRLCAAVNRPLKPRIQPRLDDGRMSVDHRVQPCALADALNVAVEVEAPTLVSLVPGNRHDARR